MKGALILVYHHILPSSPRSPFSLPFHVAASRFREHMEVLARRFSVVPLDELISRLIAGRGYRGMAAVTFDDGYADTYHSAFPLLSRMGIPATIFLVTDYIERPRVFWTNRVLSYLGRHAGGVAPLPAELGGPVDLTTYPRSRRAVRTLMARMNALEDVGDRERLLDLLGAVDTHGGDTLNWDAVREMHRHGVAFGAHTHTHPSLVMLDGAAIRREIQTSRDLIAARLGTVPATFAYPYGDTNEPVRRAVGAAGFLGAVTTRVGWCTLRSERFSLPRLSIEDWPASEFERRLEMHSGMALRLRAAIPRSAAAVVRRLLPERRESSRGAGRPEPGRESTRRRRTRTVPSAVEPARRDEADALSDCPADTPDAAHEGPAPRRGARGAG
jgi:peptidoglycan/xylan/chitin deacetylase (PgdA/CDA1 family)